MRTVIHMSDEFVLYEAVLFAIASCPKAHDHRLRLRLATPEEAKELADEMGRYCPKEMTIVLTHLPCPVQATCGLVHEFGHFWSEKVYGNPVQKLLDWQNEMREGGRERTRDQCLEILEEEVRACS